MDKLKEILSICRCSFSIEVNRHKDFYQTIKEYLEDDEKYEDATEDICKKIIDNDNIIEIWMHKDTPVGFYKIIHYDLDLAIEEALKCIK